MEKTREKQEILNTSLTELLTPRRPIVSSAIRWAGRLGLFSILCVASVGTGRAQTSVTWTGIGSDNLWSDNYNWSTLSPPSANSQIHFGLSENPSSNNNLSLVGSQAANSIIFDANGFPNIISGNTIGLTNGIANNSSTTQTLNLPVQLVGSQTWNAGSGGLTLVSPVDLNGSTLTTLGTKILTFNAAITDSTGGGSFVQNGQQITIFNGANTYTGSTTVNAGILVVNGSVASAQTTIGSAAGLGGNGTIGGNLRNNGILLPGYITIGSGFSSSDASAAAAAAAAHGITVTSGNGASASGSTASGISTSGISISGINSSNFTASSQSLMAALDSGISITGIPQIPAQNLVLTVKGNYAQGATGNLVIVYAGPAATQHNQLQVSGSASLDGALRLVQVNGARLQVGQEVPILTANGGVSGKFSTVSGATALGATVVYEPTEVLLEITKAPQPPPIVTLLAGAPGVTPNDLAVATGIEAGANDPRAAKLFAVLNADNLNQLIKDIQHINPDTVTSMSNVGSATSGVHLQNLQLRMQSIQSGATGFSAVGCRVADNSSDFSSGYAGPSGPEDKGGKEITPPAPNNRWGTFITGAGEFDHVGDTSLAKGFNLDSGGVTLGVDYRFTDHFAAGLFAGYTYTGIDIANGGRITVDAGKIGLYATYFNGGFSVDAAVQGGYDAYETNRAGLDGTAHGGPTGGDFNLLFSPSYKWTVGSLTFGPTATFQYGYQGTNGFSETGSLAPLDVSSQHTESIVSAFGVKASYDWKIGTAVVRPELLLEWRHEYGDVDSSVGGQLASGAGNSFNVTGPEIGRDSMHLGAGFAVVFNDRISSYVYYDGEFFRTNYDSSGVTGGFRIRF